MSKVYQHQLHAHKPRRRHYKRWLLAVVVVVVGIFAGLHSLKPDTQISQARVVKKQVTGNAATETFRKSNFSITLPKGWQFMGVQKDVTNIYHFRSALPGDKGNRLLDVYEDSNLPNFAINRVLPVQSTDEGGLIANASEVSDNCTAYTTGATSGRGTTGQLAKWQGIEFMCDMANQLRNVVGSGSTDGLNTVKLTSLSSGEHHYFFTYTENSDKPDYALFAAALNSFTVNF